MARSKSITLHVLMNGHPVGLYTRAADGRTTFTYTQAWLTRPRPVPLSLSLPLQERAYVGAAVSAVFENLLPDNDDIRRTIAERSGATGIDAFSLLTQIGRDCVGALQFIPSNAVPPDIRTIEAEPVTDTQIAQQLRGLASAPLGINPASDFRISLAGAQEKTAFLRQGDSWYRPMGATPTTHIMKPPIGMLRTTAGIIDMSRSVENEWLCMRLAREFGLPVAHAEITTFDDEKTLVVERFDRQWSGDRSWIMRRPQEDLLQALGCPPTLKYEADGGPGIHPIMELLKASDTADADRSLFLKAQIMFWMMAATDGHAKNFSLFLRPDNRFQLTPLYDILSLDPVRATGQLRHRDMKLAMAVGDKRHKRLDEILPRHWAQTAKRCGLEDGTADALCHELAERADGAIARTAAQLPAGFPDEIATPIFEGIRQRAAILARA